MIRTETSARLTTYHYPTLAIQYFTSLMYACRAKLVARYTFQNTMILKISIIYFNWSERGSYNNNKWDLHIYTFIRSPLNYRVDMSCGSTLRREIRRTWCVTVEDTCMYVQSMRPIVCGNTMWSNLQCPLLVRLGKTPVDRGYT